MTTDFRAELQALVDAYDEHGGNWPQYHEYGLFAAVKRARAALAEPEPEEPTPQPADGEVAELVAWLRKTSSAAFMDGWPNEESINIDRAADLLERLSTPQPS